MKYYIVFLEGPANKGIFYRQILPLKKEYQKVIIFYPLFNLNRKFEFRINTSDMYSSSVFDKCIPIPLLSTEGYPNFFSWLFCCIYLSAYLFYWRFKDNVTEFRGRGQFLGSILGLLPFRKISKIDIRGIFHDEAKLSGRNIITIKFLKFLEFLCYKNIKQLTAVTPSLIAYIRLYKSSNKIDLLEPFVDNQRDLNLSTPTSRHHKKNSAIFVGTVSSWNNIKNLERLLESNNNLTDVLFLGPEIDLKEISKKFNKVIFSNYSVEPFEVRNTLSKYEYGLVLGSNSITSLTDRTMIPSKLHEYISAGLIPIVPNRCKASKRFLQDRKIIYKTF
jgi:hypothetical protein